jgi:hypothetical protein
VISAGAALGVGRLALATVLILVLRVGVQASATIAYPLAIRFPRIVIKAIFTLARLIKIVITTGIIPGRVLLRFKASLL